MIGNDVDDADVMPGGHSHHVRKGLQGISVGSSHVVGWRVSTSSLNREIVMPTPTVHSYFWVSFNSE